MRTNFPSANLRCIFRRGQPEHEHVIKIGRTGAKQVASLPCRRRHSDIHLRTALTSTVALPTVAGVLPLLAYAYLGLQPTDPVQRDPYASPYCKTWSRCSMPRSVKWRYQSCRAADKGSRRRILRAPHTSQQPLVQNW